MMRSREHHYVITLQVPQEDGPGSSTTHTIEGTLTAGRGDTRQSLYRTAYRRACDVLEVESAVTLFCMLEPNAL